MKKKKPTIKDIARMCGVTPSTVSRALSGKGRISEATIKRINKAVKKTGFRLNKAAQDLAAMKRRAS